MIARIQAGADRNIRRFGLLGDGTPAQILSAAATETRQG